VILLEEEDDAVLELDAPGLLGLEIVQLGMGICSQGLAFCALRLSGRRRTTMKVHAMSGFSIPGIFLPIICIPSAAKAAIHFGRFPARLLIPVQEMSCAVPMGLRSSDVESAFPTLKRGG
jgi:hypothetical protein